MVLVRLNEVKVGTLALREAILSVKLELSGDNRVLTPAVQLKGSLGKNKGTSIRNTVVDGSSESGREIGNSSGGDIATSGTRSGKRIREKTIATDDRCIFG